MGFISLRLHAEHLSGHSNTGLLPTEIGAFMIVTMSLIIRLETFRLALSRAICSGVRWFKFCIADHGPQGKLIEASFGL